MTRVYVPATPRPLAALDAGEGRARSPGPSRPPDDDEDSEYAALMTAAEASAGCSVGTARSAAWWWWPRSRRPVPRTAGARRRGRGARRRRSRGRRRRRRPGLVRHPGDRPLNWSPGVWTARVLTARWHGRDHLPAGSHQRAQPDLRPRQPGAGGAGGRARGLEAKQHDLPRYIGGREANGRRRRDQGRAAARPRSTCSGSRSNSTQGRRGRRQRGPGGGAGVASDALRRALRDHPQGRRPARRAVAPADQRRDHARAVEDGLPGRDRRGVRAHRLLALQRPLRQADPHRPADREQPGHLEPHRPPPARGLRLRDHAVQLHRDRGQPAHRPGADGQHGGVEALARPSSWRRR